MSNQVYTEVITMVARMTRLKKRAVQASGFVTPDPQDIFIGLLIENESPIGLHPESYQIITNDEFGEIAEVSPAGWLKEDLKRQGAEVGDLIAITLLGKQSPYSERNKNDYILILDKES